MDWTPTDIIALASIAATVIVGVAALVVNHRREVVLHEQGIEAERAKGYREQAVDIIAFARNAIYESREVSRLPLPTTPEKALAYPDRADEALGSIVSAQQAATRMANLGWS